MLPPQIVAHCQGTTRSGQPCKAVFDLSAEGYCLMHDTKRADSPEAKRAREGLSAARRAKRKAAPATVSPEDLPCGGKLETLEDCAKWLAWIAIQTLTGRLGESKARSATEAVNTLRRQLKDERDAENWPERNLAAQAKHKEASRQRNVRLRAVGLLEGHHTELEWRQKLREYDHRCGRCGASDLLSRDHIVPLAKGGDDGICNIQVLCRDCNSWKGTQTLYFPPFSATKAA